MVRAARKKYTDSPDKRIRQRFDALLKFILKQDFLHAAEFVDPAFAKDADAKKLRQSFTDAFPFLQLSDIQTRKIRINSLKISDKADTATLIPELWAGYQWNDLPASKWIETHGDWYIDISEAQRMRPGDLIRIDRADQKKAWNPKAMRTLPVKK